MIAPLCAIGIRAIAGLRRARLPAGISRHVVLASANIAGAGLAGVLLALNRLAGSLPWFPVSLAAAHDMQWRICSSGLLGFMVQMVVGIRGATPGRSSKVRAMRRAVCAGGSSSRMTSNAG